MFIYKTSNRFLPPPDTSIPGDVAQQFETEQPEAAELSTRGPEANAEQDREARPRYVN